MTGEQVAFWILAPIAVLGAILMVGSKKAVHSALWLAATMIALAFLYIAQGAVFLGIVQIVVYTGAIMMLFLFVLMLVGVDASDSLVETLRGQRVAGVLLGLGLGVLMVLGLGQAALGRTAGLDEANAAAGSNLQGLAQQMFTRYVFAFEVVSVLLITAAVGAMVLTHRERLEPRPSQRELSERRFLDGPYPGPLPPPGVYARHNAVDTPALLPDGSVAEESVPLVLRVRGDARHPSPDATSEVAGELTRGEDA